jgi:hypothetical protein
MSAVHKPYSQYMSSCQLFLMKKEGKKTMVLLQKRKGGWGDGL